MYGYKDSKILKFSVCEINKYLKIAQFVGHLKPFT